MSRSYKKHPMMKYAPCGNWGQKQANRRVRRYKGELPNGCAYKLLYNQYNIHDCVSYYTLQDALSYRSYSLAYDEMRGWESDPNEVNITRCIQKWKRWYIRK